MTRIIRSAAFLLVLATAALLMTACADSSNSNTHSNTNNTLNNTNSMAASSEPSAADRDFMMKAAVGGMEEVELGRLATQKAASADVKAFGQRMVDDHSRAGDELKSLASQKNVTLPAALDQQHQADIDRLSKLSGAAFDREYMSMMVKDHIEDVSEFEREAAGGTDTDVKGWAGRTLPTLRQHLQMAQETAGKVGATGGAAAPAANIPSNHNASGAVGNRNAGNANRRP